jgi:glycosyltransferase involved in cell wall biosynthesis
LRILLSAYACEPGKGSEPGVGWHWALELARAGHFVTVLTRSNNRENIERGLEHLPGPHPAFLHYDLPHWAKWWKHGDHGIRVYYGLWQRSAYRWLRKRVRAEDFDLVHHLTFGVFRQASYLGGLGIPFLVGPLGGGERTPPSLLRTLPVGARIAETLRSVTNRAAAIDPALRHMLAGARWIVARTEETRDALPVRFQAQCSIAPEVGLAAEWCAPSALVPETPKFLYVARLIGWKGAHLLLEAFAKVVREHRDATLTIIGSGPEKKRLHRLADELGISGRVTWVEHVPQAALRRYYHQSLALVFPSLHDSTGSVVLESLGCGTPVICLDVPGPAKVVPDGVGFRIAVEKRDAVAIVNDLAGAMSRLAGDRTLATAMSLSALRYAKTNHLWSETVRRVYEPVLRTLTPPPTAENAASAESREVCLGGGRP